jgi:hypothetical protein
MPEYKIINNFPTAVETQLNEWRREYLLDIKHMAQGGNGTITVMLTRLRKDGF